MTTRSVPAGNSRSACHTIAGSRPETSLSVRAMSRSRLMPGNTTTAAFMRRASQLLRLGRTRPGGNGRARRQAGRLDDLKFLDKALQGILRQIAARRFRFDADDDRAGEHDRKFDINDLEPMSDFRLVERGWVILQRRRLRK